MKSSRRDRASINAEHLREKSDNALAVHPVSPLGFALGLNAWDQYVAKDAGIWCKMGRVHTQSDY